MSEPLQAILPALVKGFDAQATEFRGDVTLTLAPEHILDACSTLRDQHGFNLLADVTAVDYGPQQDPRFHVIYQLASISDNLRLCVRVPVPAASPTLASVESIFRNANWYEREIWDMFGIRFEGHSDLRRIIMPNDWEGHPLRKDYPLGYEEVQFTFNFEEIDLGKPYAKD